LFFFSSLVADDRRKTWQNGFFAFFQKNFLAFFNLKLTG